MSKFSTSDIADKLSLARQRLFEAQPDLFAFTDATHQSEWNLAHHYANEVHNIFPEYDCDSDVIKSEYGNMRPDIIVHKRGTHEFNLLVVEIKRKRVDVQDDIRKITEHWFRPPLRYLFGAVVTICDTELPYICVLENTASGRATCSGVDVLGRGVRSRR